MTATAWPPMSFGMRKGEPERGTAAWLAWFCGMVYENAHWVPPGDARVACEIAQRIASAPSSGDKLRSCGSRSLRCTEERGPNGLLPT